MEPLPSSVDGPRSTLGRALLCGAVAGLAVDLTLYPLDTIKTRLMSQNGLMKTGGLKRLYAGLPSVVVGSAPGAALFFCAYETVKRICDSQNYLPSPIVHMFAASTGEVVACLVRVPTEVLKTRSQAYPNRSMRYISLITYEREGFTGFYRGFNSTVIREIPFSAIQFPLWEYFKHKLAHALDRPLAPLEGAGCGSLAGMISAAITTPLDVAKTRIMLAEKLHGGVGYSVRHVLSEIWQIEGFLGIFSGVLPRTIWMGLGGFIFFGAYEFAKRLYGSLQGSAPWAEETVQKPKSEAHDAIYFDFGAYIHKSPAAYVARKLAIPHHRTFDDSLAAAEAVRQIENKKKLESNERLKKILEGKT